MKCCKETTARFIAPVWTMIQRRLVLTYRRCWPNSGMKESWNEELPAVGDDADSREKFLMAGCCSD